MYSHFSKRLFLSLLMCAVTITGCQHTPNSATQTSAKNAPELSQPITPSITLKTTPKIPSDGCRTGEALFDCDRRAILAMAGEYRVDFAFDEISAFRSGYKLKKPMRSGGEEWVEVIEDTGSHIALQHTLVDKSGEVTKHWRQDWDYQPRTTWRYVGHETWERRDLTPEESQNAWVQTVWQVDDSPRYAGVGRWIHDGNRTVWTSDTGWRPLPRREHTKRSDYDIVVAINRHEITADGWVHWQDNLKLDTTSTPENRYIVSEFGANRYTKINNFNFQPGRDYWNKTKDFWTQVRAGWNERFAKAKRITVKQKVDGKNLWMAMFEAAEADGPRDAATLKRRSDAVLDRYLNIE